MPRRTRVSFSSFNLYNLNLPGLRMYRNSQGWSQEQYDAKVNWSAQVIKSFRSDVWGFQELWHIDAIKDVFEAAGLADDYDLLVPENHTGGKIVCGAAVKKGLLTSDPVWIEDFPDEFVLFSSGEDEQTSEINVALDNFSRPVLKFSVRPRKKSYPISVYVGHFKSKRPTSIYYEGYFRQDRDFYKKHQLGLGAALSTIRRTAEAAALRMIITEEVKETDYPVVLIGDFNDGQMSNTLNILSDQPNYLLSGLSRGGSDTGLYSVGTLQEYRSLRDVFYTHVYKNIKESLDHILVSQEFYDNSRKRVWAFRGMEIFNDHLNNEEHKETGSTDHGVIKAEFEYRPA